MATNRGQVNIANDQIMCKGNSILCEADEQNAIFPAVFKKYTIIRNCRDSIWQLSYRFSICLEDNDSLIKISTFKKEHLTSPLERDNTCVFNSSQLAKMKKSIPDMSLP